MAELESVEVIYCLGTETGFPWRTGNDSIGLKCSVNGKVYGDFVYVPSDISKRELVKIINHQLVEMLAALNKLKKGYDSYGRTQDVFKKDH